MNTLTNTEKQNLFQRYHAGESATDLYLQAGVPRSTFYTWLKPRQTVSSGHDCRVSMTEHMKLRNHAERLELIIEVLKTAECTASSSTQDKTINERLYHERINGAEK